MAEGEKILSIHMVVTVETTKKTVTLMKDFDTLAELAEVAQTFAVEFGGE